jgi:hypothetical protein
MRWLIGRLLMRIADLLDRNLLAMPDFDDDSPGSNVLTRPVNTMTCPAPIQLSHGRSSLKSPRFTQHRKAPS